MASIPQTHSPALRLFFFWSGIIATLAYRIIVFLNGVSEIWLSVVWYIGTIGFIIYFAHRYQITEGRAKLIQDEHLDEKIAQAQGLSDEDKLAVAYVFKTLESSKEKINYIVIFVSSGIALLVGIYLDFLR